MEKCVILKINTFEAVANDLGNLIVFCKISIGYKENI